MQRMNTYDRFCQPASNVKRQPEDGCMKKLKIERSLKLRREDARGRETNLITHGDEPASTWLDCFGDQKKTHLEPVETSIERTHDVGANIARAYTKEDADNEPFRAHIQDTKARITHLSSSRYAHNPKDHGIF